MKISVCNTVENIKRKGENAGNHFPQRLNMPG